MCFETPQTANDNRKQQSAAFSECATTTASTTIDTAAGNAMSHPFNNKGDGQSTNTGSTTRETTGAESFLQHLHQWGLEKIQQQKEDEIMNTNLNIETMDTANEIAHTLFVPQEQPLGSVPDDLLEENDAGPRPFRLPIFPDASTRNTTVTGNLLYTELLMMYNKALVYHFSSVTGDYGEAMKNYQAVDFAINKLIPELIMTASISATATPQVVYYQNLMELRMRVNNNMGQITYMLGLEDTAETHFEAALVFGKEMMVGTEVASSSSKAATVERKLATATVLSNWCRVRYMNGDISDEVHTGLENVLRIRSAVLGWNHRDVASAHYNLSVAQYALGYSDDAITHLLSYLQVAAYEANQPNEQTEGAAPDANTSKQQTLDPIPALIYILLIKHEHKHDEMSQELVRGLRSLQERRADVGNRGADVASVLNFIGTLLFHQQDFEHALFFFQEELSLEESLVFDCDEDGSVSVTCNNLGRILQELNRLPEAKLYYYRALKLHYGDRIEEWCSSPKGQASCPLAWNSNHLQELSDPTIQLYSAVWYNLGLIHDKLGCYNKAANAFQVSLGLRRAMLGPNHADVACLLYNIGVLQMEQQLLLDATTSFREALRIRQVSPNSSTNPLSDRHVIQTLKKLASLYKAKGNIGGALEVTHEILNIQKKSSDVESDLLRNSEIGATMRDIADLYHAEGRFALATKAAEESIDMFRNIQIATAGTIDYVACTEELVAGLLLLGSIFHETCRSGMAYELFQEGEAMIRRVLRFFPTSNELNAMKEVTQMLATVHCAPLA